jgi:hypothetical protein
MVMFVTTFPIGEDTPLPGAGPDPVRQPADTGRSETDQDEQGHRVGTNAICLGGPCHGMLTHIDQDIGTLTVRVPYLEPEEADAAARYLVTRERVHHPGCVLPVIALHWAGRPAPCSCESPELAFDR